MLVLGLWVERTARAEAAVREDGMRIIRRPSAYRWLMLSLPILFDVFIGMILILDGAGDMSPNLWGILLFELLFMHTIGFYGFVDGVSFYVAWSEECIEAGTPLGRKQVLPWKSIRSIRYSKLGYAFILCGGDGEKIRVPTFMSGLPALAHVMESHAPVAGSVKVQTALRKYAARGKDGR